MTNLILSRLPPMDTTDGEGESSSVMFALLGAVIAFILLSSAKRTEPDVSNDRQSSFVTHLNKFVLPLAAETYSHYWTI